MRSRVGLLNELRNSLVLEQLQDGKPQEYAEQLVTEDIRRHWYLLKKRSVLRLAVQESRLR
jgi:hypothetical protein